MDRKEFLSECASFALFAIVIGAFFGIILNLVGFTSVSVTSWRYWLLYTSFLMPMITVIVLSRYNIPLNSTRGSAIQMSGYCIAGFIFNSFFLSKPFDLWQFLIWITSFIVMFICIHFILLHPWIQTRMQSVKEYFSRK